MARLCTIGFEFGDFAGENLTGTTTQVQSTVARSGTYAWRLSSLVTLTAQSFGTFWTAANSNGPHFVRFYVRFDTLPLLENRFFTMSNSTPTMIVWMTIDSAGTLKLYDEDGQITGTATLSTGVWYRIEAKYDTTAAAGSHVVEGKVDGTVFATSSTRSLSSGLQRFAVGGNLASEAEIVGDWYFDDLAFNDSSGAMQTSYPGSGKVVILRPDAAGDNAMGSRGGADSGSDFGQVDEVTPNDATDYYILDVNNDILDLALPSSASVGIGASDTITLVQPGSRSRPATAAATVQNLRVKSAASGTVQSGSSQSHDDITWKYYGIDATPRNPPLQSYTDPTTGVAWTPTGTNSLDNAQVGVIATDAAPDLWVTALWLLVEYVPAAGARPVLVGGKLVGCGLLRTGLVN